MSHVRNIRNVHKEEIFSKIFDKTIESDDSCLVDEIIYNFVISTTKVLRFKTMHIYLFACKWIYLWNRRHVLFCLEHINEFISRIQLHFSFCLRLETFLKNFFRNWISSTTSVLIVIVHWLLYRRFIFVTVHSFPIQR